MNRLSTLSLRTAAAIFILVLIAMPFWAQNASSQAPEEEGDTITVEEEITAPSSSTAPIFSYQGQLLNNSGNAITANLPMTFKLYTTATGGTACWTEVHSGANAVSVSNGLFNVLLGQITAINPATCLTGNAYLELVVNNETLTPRELLTDVAKAVEAGTVVDGSITPQKLDLNSNVDMEGNEIINVAGLHHSGGSLHPQANNWLRLISPGGVVAFIDSDNNQTDRAFVIFSNNGSFSPPGSEIFRVAENGDTTIRGNLSVSGSCSLSPVSMRMEHEGTVQAYNDSDEACEAGSITSGAYVEANLQTAAERRAGGNKQFSEGDVLCWGDGKLELCDTPNDSLVQGVADAKGNPVVLGAEPIKVIGKVKKGDYLVASSVPGYAMASKNPTFGIVIAQALENFDGEKGLIKAMIRKM